MTQAAVLKQIGELERLAAHILELKRRVRPRRPIVIEFSGSPKSGKNYSDQFARHISSAQWFSHSRSHRASKCVSHSE